MLAREAKEHIIGRIKNDIEKSNAVFLINMVGISANEAASIRKDLRKAQGKVFVTKNTLLEKAANSTDNTHVAQLFSNLQASNAIVFAFGEPNATAKCLKEARDDTEIVDIKGGCMDGRLLSVEQVQALAELPSREEMLSIVLATMMGPIAAFARLVNAIKEQKEKQKLN